MNSLVASIVALLGLTFAGIVVWRSRYKETTLADDAVKLAKRHVKDVEERETRIIAAQQEQSLERLNHVARLAREEAQSVSESDGRSVADHINDLTR